MDLPRIRQTLFIVDKNRNYKFDVNQSITIRNLKKMIIAAANLGKAGLRIFHKGVEYTDKDDQSIAELFPQLQLVEFTLQINFDIEDISTNQIKLRLGPYCKYHQYKYPYFYCYECSESICSVCVQSGNHKSHNIIEKNDYLQSSQNIVANIFQDMNQTLNSLNLDSKGDVDGLRGTVELSYFPTLMDLLRKIETRLSGLVDYFNKNNEVSFNNIKTNASLLKNHCAEGLDELKSKIEIEDMMIDEDIFLTFDRKIREISTEKTRIVKDTQKYEEYNKVLDDIRTAIETVYLDIKKFLESYLNSDFYDAIKQRLDDNMVTTVTKEEIFKRLLSDIKKKGGRLLTTGSFKHDTPRTGLFKNMFNYNQNFDDLSQNHLSSVSKSPRSSTVLPGIGIQGAGTTTGSISGNTTTNGPKRSSSGLPSFTETLAREISKQVVGQINNPLSGTYVLRPNPKTNQYEIYEEGINTIKTYSIEFPLLCGTNQFLDKSAYCNYDGKLYVSGGEELLGQGSTLFFCFNPQTNTLTRLSDLSAPRFAHSMIAHRDFIYIVGGYNNSTVEKYDIKSQKWIKMSNLLQQRETPILTVNKNMLYAFFGYDQGTYLDTIERINIKSNKSKWEVVPIKNPERIDLKMVGCGVIDESELAIYLLGGKKSNGSVKSVVHFDYDTFTFTPTEIVLDSPTYLLENNMIYLGNNAFGQFNNGEGEAFLKISLD